MNVSHAQSVRPVLNPSWEMHKLMLMPHAKAASALGASAHPTLIGTTEGDQLISKSKEVAEEVTRILTMGIDEANAALAAQQQDDRI